MSQNYLTTQLTVMETERSDGNGGESDAQQRDSFLFCVEIKCFTSQMMKTGIKTWFLGAKHEEEFSVGRLLFRCAELHCNCEEAMNNGFLITIAKVYS